MALRVIALFLAVYTGLLVVGSRIDLYAWIERGAVAVVAPLLPEGRTLAFDWTGEGPRYRYRVEREEGERELGRPYHPHGFNLVVYAALALATYPAGWRRVAVALVAGSALVFALDAGMLASDLERWERDAFGAGAPGPFGGWAGWIEGLHETSGATLVPVVVWAFLLAGPVLARTRRPVESES